MTNQKVIFRILLKWLPWRANKVQAVSVGWRRLPIPVIFSIHGSCWGAGLQTTLGGYFRFAAPQASLAIMKTKWGLIPDIAGSLELGELLQIDKALEYTMTSREITAQEALESGLLIRLADDPFAEALRFANELIEKSSDALAARKRLYQYSWNHNGSILLAKEWFLQWRMFTSKNRKIAVQKAMGKGAAVRYL